MMEIHSVFKPAILTVLISFFAASKFMCVTAECTLSPYSCGKNITNLGFPFWGANYNNFTSNCSDPSFKLRCVNDEYSLINIEDQEFRVLSVDQHVATMIIARNDAWQNLCSLHKRNTTLNNHTLFSLPNNIAYEYLTLLYGCSGLSGFACPNGQHVVYMNDSALVCRGGSIARVPVFSTVLDRIKSGSMSISDGLREGFQVNYVNSEPCESCIRSNGKCGFDKNGHFVCFNANGFEFVSPGHGQFSWKMKVTLAFSGGLTVILLSCIIICCYGKRKSLTAKKIRRNQDIEDFIRSNENLAAKRYRFSEVKKIARSFKDKLGQGGCGEVYKGKLQNGRLVAVKLLNSSNENGEDFINEVLSISRTSHVNIVTLLGFCFEGQKRALIYEFMPNGSLEKFVYNENASRTTPKLEWNLMIQIATGIARGLEYLHRGCNTRILHFDIKPHNILLDEDLCPKISDFGLAKLCPNKESCVSLLNARGTLGYIAPEVYNRNFGRVSSKSDVYSYGMLILEMVSGRKNIKAEVTRTSEIYFPNWIHKRLKLESDLRLLGDMTIEENRVAKKMIVVGLWCIQIAPSDRPPMSKVIEMLEGSLEALQIPPNPTLDPPSSPESLLADHVMDSLTSSML